MLLLVNDFQASRRAFPSRLLTVRLLVRIQPGEPNKKHRTFDRTTVNEALKFMDFRAFFDNPLHVKSLGSRLRERAYSRFFGRETDSQPELPHFRPHPRTYPPKLSDSLFNAGSGVNSHVPTAAPNGCEIFY